MNDLTPPAPDNLPALPLVSDTMIDAAFDDAVGSAALVSFVREGVFAEAIDASTTEGLERIRSRAHQIRGAKAKFEKRGKELSTQAALVPKRINQLREALKHRMEVLVEDFRKPLTDHEAAENIRKEAHEKAINEIATSPLLTVRSPVARIKERIAELNEIDLSARWEEFHGDATMAVAVRLEALNAMLADAKLMADAEKLRKEAAQRDKEMADLRAKLAAAEAEAARVAAAEAMGWVVATAAEEAAGAADTALASKMEALVMGVAAFVEDADNAASEATKAQDNLLGKPPICFTYTNWRGETRLRRAIPYFVWHRATEHHPEPQWIMCAWDLEKMEQRSFALANCDFTNLTDGMPA